MIIQVQDLRRAFEALMSHLEEGGMISAELPWDFYWEIAREELYHPYAEPKQLSLGQLSDDWNELLRITKGEMPPVKYALVWLSTVLRAVGESDELAGFVDSESRRK